MCFVFVLILKVLFENRHYLVFSNEFSTNNAQCAMRNLIGAIIITNYKLQANKTTNNRQQVQQGTTSNQQQVQTPARRINHGY